VVRRHELTGQAWERLLVQVQQHSDAVGGVDRSVAWADSTLVRAHQHAAGARKGALTACWCAWLTVASTEIVHSTGPTAIAPVRRRRSTPSITRR
jgi:hypothetical protein